MNQPSAGSSIRQSTLEQQRAAHALKCVNQIKGKGALEQEYKSVAESLSAIIVMNGLGQAAATLLARAGQKAKDKSAHRQLFHHLEEWLCSAPSQTGFRAPLMDSIVNSDQSTYFHAQAEALALLIWLKKFAQALLGSAQDFNPSK